MRTVVIALVVTHAAAAFAHPSVVPHDHPHAVSLLPDAIALIFAALLVGLGIFASRIVGLVRERLFATYFGTGLHADVFSAGLRLPNVLQNLRWHELARGGHEGAIDDAHRDRPAREPLDAPEEVLLDVMYEIPSLESVRKCVVDANVINNRSRPLLMSVNEQEIPYAETA